LEENQDVIDHKTLSKDVWEANPREYLIQAQDLMKVYGNGIAAVNKNSFCVKKGEVLGLLGPNGAGKTSTFNIMTLALQRSEGDAKLNLRNLDDLDIFK